MDRKDVISSYVAIVRCTEELKDHAESIDLRKRAIAALSGNAPMVKLAFDTRRLEPDYVNPRRGLQDYNRSELYITAGLETKLVAFKKLQKVLLEIKSEYSHAKAWGDSNSLRLLNSVSALLRVDINDENYSESQKSNASVSYLEELLYVRYRLTVELIEEYSEGEIRDVLLGKDGELKNSEKYDKGANSDLISRSFVKDNSYDDLLSKLFDIKASKDSPNVERTITITINDRIK
jgi:hypothetical protein